MAATKARVGYGTLFQRGDGANPEVFTTIAEVGDIAGPEVRQLFDDATHMESPDGYEEPIPGVRQAGDVTFPLHFLPDEPTHQLLMTDLNGGVKRNFRIIVAGGTKRWAFAGYVESIGAAHPVKTKMMRDVSIKLTGKPVLEGNS